MSSIAILGIASEIQHLRDRLTGTTSESTPVGTFWHGKWGRHDVILAQCAIGKINATMTLQRLIDRHVPRIILNCGSSGAISPRLRPGDVVIADRIVPYDAGVFLQEKFVTTGSELANRGHMHWRVFPADPSLVALARRAALQAGMTRVQDGRPSQILVGPIASGDQVIFADRPKRWLSETFGALAVENEGAAVAQVAAAHRIPWLVLRGISDTADSKAAFDYTPLLRYSDQGTGWIAWLCFQIRRLLHLLRHSQTLKNLRRFDAGVRGVNTNTAALLERLLPDL